MPLQASYPACMTSSAPASEPQPEPGHLPSRPVVLAAGGVVLDGTGPSARVLVVHRPAHDDWSLPKGHVDPDEDPATSALREVLEETGVDAVLVTLFATTEHDVGDSRKRVQWFLMHPADRAADPTARPADDEVDCAAWWSLTMAAERLTYVTERELVASATAS